jgi:hypothetical protein
MSTQMHATDETLELYSLGRLTEPDAGRLEEHLLICEDCRHRLEDEDCYTGTLRSSLRGDVKPAREPRRVALPFLSTRWPTVALAGAAIAAVLVLMTFSSRTAAGPQELTLVAQRGPERAIARARAGAPLALRINTTEIGTLASYRVEVVNAAGERMWGETVATTGNSLVATVAIELAAGQYWVRIHNPGSDGDAGPLREFGLVVE